MVTIEKSSEYNVRIMKNPDFKKKTHGYNFSYPVMNSIDICNLFISGGSIEVVMNGQPKSIWFFDMDKPTLTIKQNNKEQKYTIDNPEELGEAMIKYFDANKDDVFKKILETNLKKSQSKLENQNARKNKEENNNVSDKAESSTLENKNACFDIQFNELPKEFCSYEEMPKVLQNPVKYYQWIVINKWWDKLSEVDKKCAKETFGINPNCTYFNPFS